MMNKDLSYCIVLSSEQLSYLAGSKYGIDRMKILNRLIEATVLEQTEYSKKGFATTLQVGQAALSEVECRIRSEQPHEHSHAEMRIGLDAGRQAYRQPFLCPDERP